MSLIDLASYKRSSGLRETFFTTEGKLEITDIIKG
jgi:hypothetical protein